MVPHVEKSALTVGSAPDGRIGLAGVQELATICLGASDARSGGRFDAADFSAWAIDLGGVLG